MAAERRHQHGKACWVRDPQRQHDVVEVRAMIATRARGAVHHGCCGLLVAVIATIDMNARRVEVRRGGSQAQTLGSADRHETIACRDPIGIEGIEGPTEGVIVELVGGTAGRHEAGGGLMLEASGPQVEGLMDTPQAIEPHGFDRLTCSEVAQFRVLVGRLIDDVTHAEFVEQARDKAEMVQDLATVHEVVRHHDLL
jgi:hypothetical protein